jgi:Transposase
MSVARYRERSSMSGKKSDHGDAVTLANILRTDADQHRRLPADTELAQSITVLARAHHPGNPVCLASAMCSRWRWVAFSGQMVVQRPDGSVWACRLLCLAPQHGDGRRVVEAAF